MAAISWKSGVNGDWNTGADWSNGAIPGASDAVTIAASGAYTVTIDQNEAAQSVALKAAGATVAMSGKDVVLTIGTSFSVTAGTLSLTGNSTIIDQPRITGGTISTGAAGILLVNAVAGDTSDDEFDVNSAVSLAGTTTIATGAFLALGGGGSLGGTIGGGGQIGLGDLAYTAKAATFAASLGELTVDDNGSLALSSTSGTIAAFILLANTGTIAIASGTAITSSNYLEVGVGPLLDYQYNNVLSGPGTLVTAGAAEVLDAGTGTDMLLLGGGINWTNSGKITDYGQIAMNTVSADKVTITNAATGTFILEGGDANLLTHGAFTDGKDSFVNAGLLQRLPNPDDGSGAGTISFAASINSTGTIDVESGTLAFTDGGTLAGTLSGAGTLLLYSGTYAIGALAGSGHLSVGAGATVTYSTSTISTAYVLDNSETLAVAAGKTLVISGPFTIGDSTGGGTLAGPGTLSTTGSTTIADLGGPIPLDLEGKAVWINSGSVTDFGAVLYNQNGAGGDSETILNKGTFTLSGVDSQITPSGGGTDSFTNTGVLSRTGTGTSLLYGKLNSSGTINVASGTLQCEQGGGALSGTLSGAGTLVVADAGYTTTGLSGTGTLALTNSGFGVGTLTATATGTITGSVLIDGGAKLAAAAGKILTISGPLTIGASTVATNGGTFTGPGTITTTGVTTIDDLGTTQVLSLQGGANWVNAGVVTESGAGNYNTAGVDGDTDSILNKGSFTFAGPDAGFGLSANGTDIFTNTGTLARTGAGTSVLDGTVNSSGTINVAGGVLQVQRGGGALSGTLSGAGTLALGDVGYTTTGIAGTGTLALNNNYQIGTLTASATGTITDSLQIDGGATLAAAAGTTLTVSGPVKIGSSTIYTNGGVLSGPGTITTTGATTIADLGTTQVLGLQGGATWINTGSVTQSGVANYNTPGVDGDTDTILNKGSFALAGPDAGFGLAANGTDIFTNTGTLTRSGTGTSILDGTVNSSKIINVTGGVLQLQRGGGALSGTLSGAGTLALGDIGYTTTGVSGSGTLALNNNYQIGTLTASATGTITDSLQIDGGATLAAAAGATLTVSGPVKIGSSTIYTNGGVLSGPGTITTAGATTIADLGTTQVLGLQGGATWINTGSVTQSGVANYNTPGVDGDTDTILNKGSFTLAGPDAGFGLAANGTDIFANTGTLTRSGTGTSILDGMVNSSKIINVTGGVLQLQRGGGALSGTLSGAGTLALGDIGYTTTGLSGSGTLALNNNYQIGTLTASATGTITDSLRIDGGATLAAASGKILTVSGPVTIGGSTTYTNGGVLAGPGTITTTGATTIADLGTTQVLGLQGGVTWINTGSVTESGAGSYNTPGIDGDKVAVLNKGVFILSGPNADFALAANGTDSFTNSGTLRRAGAGTSTIDSRIAISNTGTIDAAAGTLALAGGVTGTGVITIDAGAALYIGATPNSQSITFTGGAGATLGLDTPVSRSLAGFTGGDRLDLVGTGVTSTSISGTTLTVVTGSGTLQFISAGLAGEVAATSADAGGGTYVSIYRPAAATHTPEPLAFGNYHVGATVGTKLALTVSNTDPADGYSEKLNAGLGAASAGFTASGTVTGIAAGASNSTSLTATIDTSTAGAKTGTATLTLATLGTGIDGRGTTALTSQTVNLSGAVYAYAAASLASSSITLANHHVGDTPSAFLTLSNTAATGAYSEGLDAKFTAATGAATGTGSVSLLTAGASNSTSLGIGLAAAAGGVATGTETLTFISDGQGTSGLGTTTLGTQAVSVTGTFYALATGTLASGTVAFGNHHVGDIIAAKLIKLTNGAPTGGFSEALDASLTATGAITATGSISRLAAGASNSTSLSVGEVASAAGTIGGSLVLNLVSDGTAIDGLGTTTLLGQTITVTGANYALASGTLASSTINLGVIHASTAASAVLSLTNGAPTGGYGESLDAGLSLASAGLSTHGTVSRLAAGVKDTTSLSLSVNTATTGQYSGSAMLGLISDGTGTSGLGTTTLTSQTVTVTATVDNYAASAFEDPSGPAITGSSTNATINLGSTLQGNAALTLSLGAINTATGLSDLLAGTISTAGGAGFTNSGFGAIGSLSAGQDEHAQGISLATSTAGTFSETVTLSTYGTNASGYDGALTPETLTVTGTITPSIFHTYTLGLGPNTINGADGLGDIFVASAGALNTRDQLTGGSGANSLTLAGAGLFDVNAPSVFTNIPTIVASEGQAAMGSAADTRQTVMLRDNAVETLKVATGISASGNTNPEAITIYAFGGTDTIALAAGTDQVLLGTGNATVTLGGVSNSVTAGGGTALVHSTGALAGAAVIGAATGSTTLDITTGGAITLNAADSYLTVQLHAASNLTLSSLSFITAIGSSGADTLTALATSQSLTGGAGADILNGYSGGGDSFADTAAGLNGDTINNWTTGDVIDITNIAAANLHPLTFASNTLTATDGTTTTAIKFAAGEALGNFTVLGADGAGTGVLIAFHA